MEYFWNVRDPRIEFGLRGPNIEIGSAPAAVDVASCTDLIHHTIEVWDYTVYGNRASGDRTWLLDVLCEAIIQASFDAPDNGITSPDASYLKLLTTGLGTSDFARHRPRCLQPPTRRIDTFDRACQPDTAESGINGNAAENTNQGNHQPIRGHSTVSYIVGLAHTVALLPTTVSSSHAHTLTRSHAHTHTHT